jgi:hypothetical protein
LGIRSAIIWASPWKSSFSSREFKDNKITNK